MTNIPRRLFVDQIDFDDPLEALTPAEAYEAQVRIVGLLLRFHDMEHLTVEELLSTTDIRNIVRDTLRPCGIFQPLKGRVSIWDSPGRDGVTPEP